MSRDFRLFISHSWSYSDQFNRLKNLLDNRSYFYYTDYSIPQDDPVHTSGSDRALYQAIKRHISPCNVVIILAGVYSSYSRWIDSEIFIANEEFSKRKPILGIRPWGNVNISQKVQENADLIVGWNTESIVDGIRKLG